MCGLKLLLSLFCITFVDGIYQYFKGEDVVSGLYF